MQLFAVVGVSVITLGVVKKSMAMILTGGVITLPTLVWLGLGIMHGLDACCGGR